MVHRHRVEAKMTKTMVAYLSLCRPEVERISVSQTGWAPTQDDSLIFVRPGQATHGDYFFQPEKYARTTDSVRQAGTLQDWNSNNFSLDPYPLFMICASLAAPLIKWAGMPSAGINIYGETTSGKTTLLQLAASVWGDGSEPSGRSYINRWNMTANALEAFAAGHNDLPSIFDELASMEDRSSQGLVYDLSGGQGKAAMDSARNLKKQRQWTTFLISSGEISMLEKLQQSQFGKKHAKAGAVLRIIDLLIEEGAIRSADESDRIKRTCSRYYGTLGPAYIDGIVNLFTKTKLQKTVQKAQDEALVRITQSVSVNKVQQRALKIFALVEVAGLLLVHLKLIPDLTIDDIRSAIDSVAGAWIPEAQDITDGKRTIKSIRDFILANRDSRFKLVNVDGSIPSSEKDKQNLAGYICSIKGAEAYFLFPSAFAEATDNERRNAAEGMRRKNCIGRISYTLKRQIVEHSA